MHSASIAPLPANNQHVVWSLLNMYIVLLLYFVHYAMFQKQISISENGLVSVLSSFCWSEFSRWLIELQKTELVSRMLCCFLEHYMMDKVQIPSNHI